MNQIIKKSLIGQLIIGMLLIGCSQKTLSTTKIRNYTLSIQEVKQNIKGKLISMIQINGQQEAPIIEANLGETLVINVDNQLDRDTILHWHGVLVPNDQDGVLDYTTDQAIKPGSQFKYQFKVQQTGTYWYHAHTLDEQQGLHGGIIFKNKAEASSYQEEFLMLSDASAENPDTILNHLQSNHMYYHKALEKKRESNQAILASYGIEKTSSSSISSHHCGGKEMCGMQMGHQDEVAYDSLLVNGATSYSIKNSDQKKIKLRLVNAGTSTIFRLYYAPGFEVVASDGLPVFPIKGNKLEMTMGETIDLIIDRPDKEETMIFASGDLNDFVSVKIGEGSPNTIQSNNFNHSRLLTFQDFETNLDQNPLKELLNTAFTSSKKSIAEELWITFKRKGMYNWKMLMKDRDNQEIPFDIDTLKAIAKDQPILLHLKNDTDMPHPIHLHGHYFQVLLPSKKRLYQHTVNVKANQEVDIVVNFNEKGSWAFHCHNLYHMASGFMSGFRV